ncbi:MAG: hypothetical protein HIU89_16485 [Proteobacteria bacterium]|nr:hypothetical protein [Pseudomonadota bacterium]
MAAKCASRALASTLSLGGLAGARVTLTVFPVVVSLVVFGLSGGDDLIIADD